jgi:hypothetical protein
MHGTTTNKKEQLLVKTVDILKNTGLSEANKTKKFIDALPVSSPIRNSLADLAFRENFTVKQLVFLSDVNILGSGSFDKKQISELRPIFDYLKDNLNFETLLILYEIPTVSTVAIVAELLRNHEVPGPERLADKISRIFTQEPEQNIGNTHTKLTPYDLRVLSAISDYQYGMFDGKHLIFANAIDQTVPADKSNGEDLNDTLHTLEQRGLVHITRATGDGFGYPINGKLTSDGESKLKRRTRAMLRDHQ